MLDNNYGTINSLTVTMLIEDYSGYDEGLLAQHGISFLLEAKTVKGSKTILFDAGQSADPILHNMKMLGKDPSDIDMVILSHCHSDHTGGLVDILKAIGSKRLPVIAHPATYRSNFVLKPAFKSFGMEPANSAALIESAGGEMLLVAETLALAPGIVTTGEITDKIDFEANPTLSMFTLDKGEVVSDSMLDDLSMVFILDEGLVIVTGCSHAGVISIIETAVRITGVERVAAVIGGFHLIDADDARIEATVKKMADYNIDRIYTGHCTGLKAEARLQQAFGKKFKKTHTGIIIKF